MEMVVDIRAMEYYYSSKEYCLTENPEKGGLTYVDCTF